MYTERPSNCTCLQPLCICRSHHASIAYLIIAFPFPFPSPSSGYPPSSPAPLPLTLDPALLSLALLLNSSLSPSPARNTSDNGVVVPSLLMVPGAPGNVSGLTGFEMVGGYSDLIRAFSWAMRSHDILPLDGGGEGAWVPLSKGAPWRRG